MNIKFINYNGIKEYARVMYNDVKDADKYKIEVAYNGKDVKDLLEYLFKLESKIDKAIELYENTPINCDGVAEDLLDKIIFDILKEDK